MKNRKREYIGAGESVRIRFTDRMLERLIREKDRTGRSVSEIVRIAVIEYFGRRNG